MASICFVCGDAILDKYLLKVGDNFYHSDCVRCSECHCPLSNSCYHRNGANYCLNDFTLKFGKKCRGCNGPLYLSDLVHKLPRENDFIIYHVACFRCSVCSGNLATGCEFHFTFDGKIVCRDDHVATESDDSSSTIEHCTNNSFETNSALVTQQNDVTNYDILCDVISDSQQQQSDLSMEDFLDSKAMSSPWMRSDVISDVAADDVTTKSEVDFETFSNHSPNCEKQVETTSVAGSANQKRRGPRTTIKAKQLDTLKSAFASTPKPTRHIREQLAQDTGLTMRVIQVWFQNRRSKERRMKQMNVLTSRRHFFDRGVSSHLLRDSVQQSDCIAANARVQHHYYTGIDQPLPSQSNFDLNYASENMHGAGIKNWSSQVSLNMAEKDNLFNAFNPLVKSLGREPHNFYNVATQSNCYGSANF